MSYTFRVYILDGKECFEYGTGEDILRFEYPLGETLLELLYFDIFPFTVEFNQMGKELESLYAKKEWDYAQKVLFLLREMRMKHPYFELTYLVWDERLHEAEKKNFQNARDMLPRKELTHIPANVTSIQKQIRLLFDRVLDIDSGKEPLNQKLAAFYRIYGEDRLKTFQFSKQKINFEMIDKTAFTDVLYPDDIYDIIDFFLREFIKREHRIRVCKNCRQYFFLTGRSDAEYCLRPIDNKGHTCRSMGSINLWNKKKEDDEIFKIYRREYKRRFGWIRARKIHADDFYKWSELAREQKTKCENGEISMEEFAAWLKK